MRRSSISLLILVLLIVFSTPLFSAKRPVEIKSTNPAAKSKLINTVAGNESFVNTESNSIPRVSLGLTASSSTPGVVVGHTWYDQQHNGSMGRMIEFHDSGPLAAVHMNWMYLEGPAFAARSYLYNSYDITNEVWGGSDIPQSEDDYGGYVSICVTNDNRGIPGGHNEGADGLSGPHYWFDFTPLMAFWGYDIQVPQSLQNYGDADPPQEAIWPKARFIETPTDTFLHIIAQVSEDDAGDPQAIYYFRRVGSESNPAGVWDDPPMIIDTIYDISHDIAASEDGGKVALV